MSNDRLSRPDNSGAPIAAERATHARPNIRLVSSLPDALCQDQHYAPPAFVERPPRYVLVEPAHLQIGTQILTVQTIDISQGGVKLLSTSGSLLAEPGREAALSLLGMHKPLAGSIRWCANGRIGFRLETELSGDVLECIRMNPSLQVRRAYLNGRLVKI